MVQFIQLFVGGYILVAKCGDLILSLKSHKPEGTRACSFDWYREKKEDQSLDETYAKRRKKQDDSK